MTIVLFASGSDSSLVVAVLALIVSIIGLLVSAGNALRAIDQARYSKRVDLSLSLVTEYFGQDFTIVQRGAWRVRQKWMQEPACRQPTALYFCTDKFDNGDPRVIAPDFENNNLTPLQNVTRYMAFWHRFVVLDEAHLIENTVVRPLQSEFVQWSDFMKSLSSECELAARGNSSTNRVAVEWGRVIDVLTSRDWKHNNMAIECYDAFR